MKLVTVDLLPPSRPLTDRAMRLSQQIRAHDAELANLLMRLEQESRKGTREQKAKRADVAKDGRKVRGGKAYVNMENPDITYEVIE